VTAARARRAHGTVFGMRGGSRGKRRLSGYAIVVGLFFAGLLAYLLWASDRSDISVRGSELVRAGAQVSVRGTLANRGDLAYSSFAVEVAYFDSEHRRIGRASAVVQKLGPRSEIRFATQPLVLAEAVHYQVTLPALATPYGN